MTRFAVTCQVTVLVDEDGTAETIRLSIGGRIAAEQLTEAVVGADTAAARRFAALRAARPGRVARPPGEAVPVIALAGRAIESGDHFELYVQDRAESTVQVGPVRMAVMAGRIGHVHVDADWLARARPGAVGPALQRALTAARARYHERRDRTAAVSRGLDETLADAKATLRRIGDE